MEGVCNICEVGPATSGTSAVTCVHIGVTCQSTSVSAACHVFTAFRIGVLVGLITDSITNYVNK